MDCRRESSPRRFRRYFGLLNRTVKRSNNVHDLLPQKTLHIMDGFLCARKMNWKFLVAKTAIICYNNLIMNEISRGEMESKGMCAAARGGEVAPDAEQASKRTETKKKLMDDILMAWGKELDGGGGKQAW